MATGASTCALAIILIDARNGVQIQTRRHSYNLPVRNKACHSAINKMDLVDYEESIFNKIKEEFIKFSATYHMRTCTLFHFQPLRGKCRADR